MAKAKEQTGSLHERSNELKRQTSNLPDQAEVRVREWGRSCELSGQYLQDAEEWLNTATKELQRAQNELYEAERDYIDQKNLYKAAVEYYNITTKEIEGRNSNGKKEYGPNQAWNSARINMEEQRRQLDIKEKVFKEKTKIHERAKEQKKRAEEAFSITEDLQSKSENFLKRAFDIKEWACDAEKFASHALNTVESALKLNEEAEAKCKKQNEIIEETIRQYEKIKSCHEDILYVSQNISEQTNSCSNIITRFAMVLNNKKTLLHRLSAILPDKIVPFNL